MTTRCIHLSLFTLHLSLFTLLCHASPLDKLEGVKNADVSLNGSWHFQLSAIEPHQKGTLELPANNWKERPQIGLSFLNTENRVIDHHKISLGEKPAPVTPKIMGMPTVSTEGNDFVIQSDDVQYRIDKTTGLMKSIAKDGNIIPLIGPFPHIFKQEGYMIKGINPEVGNKPTWTMGSDLYQSPDIDARQFTKMHVNREQDTTKIHVRAKFSEIDMHYVFTFGIDGRFDVKYFFEDIPPLPEPEGKHSNQGALDLEVGINFQTSDQFDQLSWEKNSYWSSYHLDRLDYHLRWANYSADIRPKSEHNGTAEFTIGNTGD